MIHAGDVCDRGNAEQANDFFDWLADLPYEHKLLIWGNHDFDLQSDRLLFANPAPDGVSYLDSRSIEINGIAIWGTPTPANKSGEPYDLIPNDVDLLITHRPPAMILDRSRLKGSQGSKRLAKRLEKVSPSVHVFGHIHRSYGTLNKGPTTFINASLYRSSAKKLVNEPITFEL